jgi:membrane protein implicated in regulation of membrane protease activity
MTNIFIWLIGPGIVAAVLWIALQPQWSWLRSFIIVLLFMVIASSSLLFFDVYARARTEDMESGQISSERLLGIREMLEATTLGRVQIIAASFALMVLALRTGRR